MTFDIEDDLGSSFLFQKWILRVRIIWKSGITLLSRHIISKVIFSRFRYANFMLISYYANKKSSPRLPSWQPSLIFFNIPIKSGSIIKPCTLKLFQATFKLHKAGYWTTMRLFVSAHVATCSKT